MSFLAAGLKYVTAGLPRHIAPTISRSSGSPMMCLISSFRRLTDFRNPHQNVP